MSKQKTISIEEFEAFKIATQTATKEKDERIAILEKQRIKKQQLIMCISDNSDSEMHISIHQEIAYLMRDNKDFLKDFSVSLSQEREVTCKKLSLEVLRVKRDEARVFLYSVLKNAIKEYKSK